MSDFNPLQMITRIATNIVAGRSVQNNSANGANNTQGSLLNNALNHFNKNFNTQNNNEITYFQAKPLVLSEESGLKLTTIEIEKKADYVKDLLNLPKDLTELISQITTGSAPNSPALNPKILNQLMNLLSDGKIDLSRLSEFLGENSKAAMQKLMMTIANLSRYGANDVSNLKELMGLFSMNTNISSETQALKTLLLLYLPWLPLAVRTENDLDFTIDIFDKIDGPDPDSKEEIESVKILIQTENFANVTAALEMNPIGQIDIDIAAGDNFPHKRVMEIIKEESSINGIKSNVSSSASRNKNKSAEEFSSSNVKIESAGAISPKLMLMTQCIIKIIIQLDYEKSVIKEETSE